jgi:hypothetical protein
MTRETYLATSRGQACRAALRAQGGTTQQGQGQHDANVRNVTEGGGLQPIGANPDGTYTGFRIISPRVFILSATFEL